MGKPESEHGVGLPAKKSGVGMIVDRATGPIGEVGRIPDVVPVAMGEQEGVWLQFFLFQKVEEAFGGIDGQEVAAEVDEVGIGSGQAAAIT